MEGTTYIENEIKHSVNEFSNLWVCQKQIREWSHHPEWDSYDVLPVLYKALHTGKKYVPGLSSSPKLIEVVRSTDAHISGSPANLLPEARYVYLLTSKYTTALDTLLRRTPKTAEQTITDAAFSYYVFDRIHPFPDGNGRIGRMIVKRVFKGGGLKDPIFHDHAWYGEGRSEHLESLERVDETNNLSHLEVFLAKSLINLYDPITEFFKYREIAKIISKKEKEAEQNGGKKLSDIWEGFSGLPMYGNDSLVEN